MSLDFRARVDDRGLDVEFAIAPGETVALLGPNGAGKSSVLSLVAGLLHPDSGQVVLNGRTLVSTSDGTDLPPHRRHVALLAQQPLLFPHLTLRENVAFGPRSLGRPRGESRNQADLWLARVGVADLAARKPAEVSGGQGQRAALARALAVDPQLLLLDEPLAALDVAVAPDLRHTLRQLLADRTALLVTHDVLDALLLADRVLVLDHGRIVEHGPTREVLSHPRSPYTAQLAGLNLLSGTWQDDHVVLPDGTTVHGLVAGPPPSSGEPVVATFRPHAVAIYPDQVAGSPRNSFDVQITEIEPLGDLFRVRTERLSADVTAQAVVDLGLAAQMPVRFSVKATEVAIYGL
ncbi:MAG: transporter related protein [Marmoricola sp.]|nr:transporter related protein [Marmoricola sp.]